MRELLKTIRKIQGLAGKTTLLLVVIHGFCMAQSFNKDSLWKVVNSKAIGDTNRLKALNNISWVLRDNDPDSAILLAERQMKETEGLKDAQKIYWIASAKKTIGASLISKGKYQPGLESLTKASELFKQMNDKNGVAGCYTNIGVFYWYQSSNYPKALEYYLKALKLYEETGNKKGIGAGYINVGLIYQNQNNYKKALEYYEKALKNKQEAKDVAGAGRCYLNMTVAYKELRDFNNAIQTNTKALDIFKANGEKRGIAYCYNNFGNIYKLMLNYKEALVNYKNSLLIRKETKDKQGIATCYVNIGSIYSKTGDFVNAARFTDSSLQMAKEIGDIDIERSVNENLAEIYEKKGEYKKALTFYQQFKKLTDSIYNAETTKQLGDLKTQYEIEKREAELQLKADAEKEKLKAVAVEEKKSQKIFFVLIISLILFVALIVLLLLYLRYSNEKKQKIIAELQKQKADEELSRVDLENTRLKLFNQEAQYKLLQDQINPHFLFNTLETISALISKTPDLAKEFVFYLSDFLRINIQSNERLVSLKEELILLNNYKELQTIRFGDAIKIQADIDEATKEEIKTPYFSLLTLVENAIKHNGFTKEKPLTIKISCDEEYIIVENNTQKRNSLAPSTKTGLTNLNERYMLILNKGIHIIRQEKSFIVKLPIARA